MTPKPVLSGSYQLKTVGPYKLRLKIGDRARLFVGSENSEVPAEFVVVQNGMTFQLKKDGSLTSTRAIRREQDRVASLTHFYPVEVLSIGTVATPVTTGNQPTERHRVLGEIEEARGPYREDHGILTVSVRFRGRGYSQSMGGLALDQRTAPAFVTDLCAAFGVKQLAQLKGQACYALYSFGRFNDFIDGLESVETGKRFIIDAWRRKYFPDQMKGKTRLSQEQESLRMRIKRLQADIVDAEEDLHELESLYVNWESAK